MNQITPINNDKLSADALAVLAVWEGLLAREKCGWGRELHADVAQVLTALRLELALFIRQHNANPDLMATANRMLAMTDHSLQAVGKLLNHLQSPCLEQGLQVTLEQLCWDFSQRHLLPCKLTFDNELPGLDKQHSNAVIGIVQEALSNIARHAAAKNADIICKQTAEHIEISVLDDGCGFDLAQTLSGCGLGLHAMRWRAMSIGGRLVISNNQPSGAQVTLLIPLLA